MDHLEKAWKQKAQDANPDLIFFSNTLKQALNTAIGTASLRRAALSFGETTSIF